jgi:LmbE family N-acetylglucosaminyl deacetylase
VQVLAFRDSGMAGEPAPDTLCGADFDVVTQAVRSALEQHRPDVVVTLDGSDGHRDHVRLRDVVKQLLAGAPKPLYLQCLPRSLMHAWVRHHMGDPGAATYTELPEIGTPDDELTTVIDTTEHLAVRDEAIALHRSQRSPFEGLPTDLRQAFLGRDHLIRVNPPWSGGPLEHELAGLVHHRASVLSG